MTATKRKVPISKILLYAVLTLVALIYVLPFVWVVSVSLKTRSEVFGSPFSMPESAQWVNYVDAWTKGNLGQATLNSFLVCTITLVCSMLIGSMAAFAIGRMRWKLNESALGFFMIGMMVPVHCILIPLFISFANFNLNNSLLGLILPYVTFSLPLTIYIMTGFFRSLPGEVFESACIDGCTIYGVFFKMAIPLGRTGLFVTGLMSFVNNWNELLMAMVFISDAAKKTLPVTLTYFVGPYATNYEQMFAAIVIAMIPTIVVYCIFSNQIVDGLTAGAVKG